MSEAVYWGRFGGDPWHLQARGDRAFRSWLLLLVLLATGLAYWAQRLPPLSVARQNVAEAPPPLALSLVTAPAEVKPQAVMTQAAMSQVRMSQVSMPKAPPKPAASAAPPAQSEPGSQIAPGNAAAASPPNRPEAAQHRDLAPGTAGLLALKSELRALHGSALPRMGELASSGAAPAKATDPDSGGSPPSMYRGSGDVVAEAGALVGKALGQLESPVRREERVPGQGLSAAVNVADRGAASSLPGRTLEEIQLAFEAQKLAFFALFRRATRDGGLPGGGAVVVSLTVSPRGQVTDCRIVSSSIRDPQVLAQLLEQVRGLRFESKNVPVFTYSAYPIMFIPS